MYRHATLAPLGTVVVGQKVERDIVYAELGGRTGLATLRAMLDTRGIKHQFRESDGGHNWRQWRPYLSEFAPVLCQ